MEKDEETKRIVVSVEEQTTRIERLCEECAPDLAGVLDVDAAVATVAGVAILRAHRLLDDLGKAAS